VLEFSLTIYYTAEQLTASTETICSMKLGDKERNKLGDKERNKLGDKERNKLGDKERNKLGDKERNK
jgi:hypothetical protein